MMTFSVAAQTVWSQRPDEGSDPEIAVRFEVDPGDTSKVVMTVIPREPDGPRHVFRFNRNGLVAAAERLVPEAEQPAPRRSRFRASEEERA